MTRSRPRHLRLVEPPSSCPEQLQDAADWAITTRRPVVVGDLVVVPDVVVAEAIAAGEYVPEAPRLLRERDGRCVHVFATPEQAS